MPITNRRAARNMCKTADFVEKFAYVTVCEPRIILLVAAEVKCLHRRDQFLSHSVRATVPALKYYPVVMFRKERFDAQGGVEKFQRAEIIICEPWASFMARCDFHHKPRPYKARVA